jgi:hypothetical protein
MPKVEKNFYPFRHIFLEKSGTIPMINIGTRPFKAPLPARRPAGAIQQHSLGPRSILSSWLFHALQKSAPGPQRYLLTFIFTSVETRFGESHPKYVLKFPKKCCGPDRPQWIWASKCSKPGQTSRKLRRRRRSPPMFRDRKREAQ